MADIEQKVKDILQEVKDKDPHQAKFLQAAEEVVLSLTPLFKKKPDLLQFLRKICEPERVIMFRVPWMDRNGKEQMNRGFRIQFNGAIGPYKGGLRLHPTVDLSTLKFLAFEQIFKNALTTLPMGGGKGGSDFDPKGKNDAEVMSFCQSFMTELFRHIGPYTDVPAGDIGVGKREIGFMFGQYKRLVNRNECVLTGKGALWGGSKIRPEATGYGLVYYLREMLKKKGTTLEGKKVLVSGAGNVSQYCIERLLDYKAIPICCSDSRGYIVEPEGFTRDKLKTLMHVKNVLREPLTKYAELTGAKYVAGKRCWEVEGATIALPCATENEIEEEDAKLLIKNGIKYVAEGANMPSNLAAINLYKDNKVYFGPAKAANAGGVATSGLEMVQGRAGLFWGREKVDKELDNIMVTIFNTCAKTAEDLGDPDNLLLGANCAGYEKVALSMKDFGCI